MEKRILKCGLIGGLTVFIWGFISWAILPWHEKTFNQFKDEKKVYEALKDNAPVSGIYILPNMYASSKGMSSGDMRKVMESRQQMMVNGPVMFASVCREGLDGMKLKPFIVSLIIQVVAAGLITWMLLQTKLNVLRKQVGFVTLVGFLVGLLGVLPSWNWWGFSISYTMITMMDLIIGWFLGGFVISKLIKR